MSASSALHHRRIVLLLVAYFFSGIVGLCYEVLWIKMLALQFGVSIFGVVVTVSAFMAGLGLGCLSYAKKSFWIKQPLRVYAAIEFIVALLTFCLPELFRLNQDALNSLAVDTSIGLWMTIQLSFAFFILFIPAFLMGAGFVFVLRTIQAQYQAVALFYGINALGAAIGSLLPLLLIPLIGWLDTLFLVASIGVAIAISSYLLSRYFPQQEETSPESGSSKVPRSMLFGYAMIGLLAMVLQIAWTRLFGMLLLRTEYVAAMIIAVFILGIGVGSLVANKLKYQRDLALIPLIIGMYSIAGLWILPHVNSYVAELNLSWFSTLSTKAFIVFVLAFPVTMALGAWFPLLTAKFQDSDRGATGLYAVNSLGAAVGAALTGFALLPLIGANASVVLAGLLFILVGSRFAHSRVQWPVFASCALISIPVFALSPVAELMPGMYTGSRDLYVHENAISLTHVVEQQNGQRVLLSDLQRMDASSDPTSVESQRNQLRLPLLLHPQPRRILLLGLGTGISASAALTLPDAEVTAVEISQGAINAAAKYFDTVNGNISAKINIVNDDARHYLMSESKRFDVIVGDLFHPDLVGRSALLSLQQFSRVKSRLADNGVFVQWLALNQFDIDSLDIMLRTFKRVFSNSHIFVDGFRVAMVAFEQPSNDALAQVIKHKNWQDTQLNALTGSEGIWTWLGRYAFPIEDSEGLIQDEWRPQIEYRLPRAKYNGDIDLAKIVHYVQSKRLHVDIAKIKLGVSPEDMRNFENAYIANALSYQSWIAELQGDDKKALRLLQLSYRANAKDRWIAFALADRIFSQLQTVPNDKKRELLTAVLSVRSDHVQALKARYQMELAAGNEQLAAQDLARIHSLSPLEIIN